MQNLTIPVDVIKKQMEKAVRDSLASNNQRPGVMDIRKGMPHHVLTELLHEYAYIDNRKAKKTENPVNGNSVKVNIMYTGKKAEPIQLRCLHNVPVSKSVEPSPPLRVSLISMRHLTLDHVVDMALFLNMNLNERISSDEIYVDQDTECYRQTQKHLRMFAAKGIRHIHLYQTGYQIAVIGFYRALIEYLLEQQKKGTASSPLTVTPYYCDKNSNIYRKGKIWS